MKYAVIGAGLSGLTVTRSLVEAHDVTCFEALDRPGGRLATQRHDPFSFDYGAQFFSAKDPTFQDFLVPLIERGTVQHWLGAFVEFEGPQIVSGRNWTEEPAHFVASPGMDTLGTALSEGLDIRYNTNIQELTEADGDWFLVDQQGRRHGPFDWVIVTMPAPVVARLLPCDFVHYNVISNISMMACYSLMLGFDTPPTLSFDAALVREADISWISVNSSKPQRDAGFSLLVHSTNKWADAHLDAEPDQVIETLLQEASRITGQNLSDATYVDLHQSPFANSEKQPSRAPFVDREMRLAVCGDWTLHGRVEAAYLSGLQTAEVLLETLWDRP